jgi:uncharacterized protein (DUF3084 family)
MLVPLVLAAFFVTILIFITIHRRRMAKAEAEAARARAEADAAQAEAEAARAEAEAAQAEAEAAQAEAEAAQAEVEAAQAEMEAAQAEMEAAKADTKKASNEEHCQCSRCRKERRNVHVVVPMMVEQRPKYSIGHFSDNGTLQFVDPVRLL